MRIRHYFTALAAAAMIASSCDRAPRTDHVIIMGFDAMSAIGLQRAHTPSFNYMIDNGAVSLHTRCVRETSSSQNWMSMVSAAPIEQHGVLGNKWNPADVGKKGVTDNIPPYLHNEAGFFPTIFDHIHQQRPDVRQAAYIEWTGETRMYNMNAFDEAHVMKMDDELHKAQDVIRKAFADYLEKRPEMLFLSMDITDDMGHTFGHESKEYFDCISEMDAIVGEFVHELEARGWMKNTVIIVTADHGGISAGHGGDSMAEFEIPVILFGEGVTKGKILRRGSMIYDVGATAAGLLGVELPWECRGKMLTEAFEPGDGDVYSPVPLVTPFAGLADGLVTITADASDTEIRYTLDGSTPDENSTLYEGPFSLTESSVIRSVCYRKGCRSMEAENYLFPEGLEPSVAYKLYKNYTELSMPDFTKFGKADSEGFVNTFSLDEFGLNDEDYFVILFTSHLIIGEEGEYTFGLKSDDGSKLYIDGALIIDNGTSHSSKSPLTKTISLSEGRHTIKLEYQEYTKTQSLDLSWAKKGDELRPVLPVSLSR